MIHYEHRLMKNIGGFAIGSFNVLHFQSEGNTDRNSFEERQMKAKQIAEIIRSENFAIVCLQECLRETTNGVISPAERITNYLNGGLSAGKYDCLHCSHAYDQLKDYGYKFRSANESRGEYAFVWDKTRLTFDRSAGAMIVYNAINEQLTRGLDMLIASATTYSLFLHRRTAEKEKKKKNPDRMIGGKRGTNAITSAVAVGASAINHAVANRRREQIQSLLQASLRPPFVGLFTLNHDTNKQLRLINVHTQWGKIAGEDTTGSVARNIEMKYLIDVVFPTVETQRSGFYETAFTVMAGDFNLTADSISRKLAKTQYGSMMCVAQRESTKWYLKNPREVARREQLPIHIPIEKRHDYDHFVFSRSCWNEDSGSAIHTNPNYMIGDGFSKHPISDHYPVRLDTHML